MADIAASVSTAEAASDSQRSRAVAVVPPPVEGVRPLPAWFQGRVLLPGRCASFPEIRLGVRAVASGGLVAIFDSDPLGRFSFAVPPVGAYQLVVLDSDYQGEMTFASDGRTAFPLEFPIATRTHPSEQDSAPLRED